MATNRGSKKAQATPVIQVPVSQLQNQQINSQMQGPGETLALLSGKLPDKDIPKALEIMHDREKNAERERLRQYKAFKFSSWIKYLGFGLVFITFVALTIYLYEKGNNRAAETILTALISLGIGGLGGYGYASKRNQ